MANISRRHGGVLYSRTPSDTRAEPQCEIGDILLAGVHPEDDLHGGGMGKYIPGQTNNEIIGEVLIEISDKTIPWLVLPEIVYNIKKIV